MATYLIQHHKRPSSEPASTIVTPRGGATRTPTPRISITGTAVDSEGWVTVETAADEQMAKRRESALRRDDPAGDYRVVPA